MKSTDKEISLDWSDIDKMIEDICLKIRAKLGNDLEDYEIIAITKGGIIPATIISYNLGIKSINLFPMVDKKIIHDKIPRFDTAKKYLLVDEIYDTGETFSKTATCLGHINHLSIFLIQRYSTANPTAADHIIGKTIEDSRWVVFPWEKNE